MKNKTKRIICWWLAMACSFLMGTFLGRDQWEFALVFLCAAGIFISLRHTKFKEVPQ